MTASPTSLYGAQIGEATGTDLETSLHSPCRPWPEATSNHYPIQTACRIETLSSSIDSFARARVLAAMALNIFVFDAPLNSQRDRWICPFLNCKEDFLDAKKMMQHALDCEHVSAHDAYCSCCRKHYILPNCGQACTTSGVDSTSSNAKGSAMTKLKRKTADLIARCRSPSSSRGHMSPVSPTSTAGSTFNFHILPSGMASPRRQSTSSSSQRRDAPVHLPAEMHSNHLIEMHGDHLVELDVSPEPKELAVPTECMNFGTSQSSQFVEPNGWTMGDPISDYTGSGQFSQSEEHVNLMTPHDPNATIPYECNLSFEPLSTAIAPASWEVSPIATVPYESSNIDGNVGITQGVASSVWHNFAIRSRNSPGDHFFNSQHSTSTLYKLGSTHNSDRPPLINETYGISANSPTYSTATSPGSSSSEFQDLKCPYCNHRPRGAMRYREANLKKHVAHVHGDRKPYYCVKGCEKVYTRVDNLKHHQKSCKVYEKSARRQRFNFR